MLSWISNKTYEGLLNYYYKVKDQYVTLSMENNSLKQKVHKLEREIHSLKEICQKDRQELKSLKRDIMMHSKIFVKDSE